MSLISIKEDERGESIPVMESFSKEYCEDAKEEDNPGASDSDDAPDEVTISTGKEESLREEESVKREMDRHRQTLKEKRKQQHEKNKLQQEEKRKRLEERRLPQSILNAAAEEQKERASHKERKVKKKNKKNKKRIFSDLDIDGEVKGVDEEGNIFLDTTAVKIRTLKEETGRVKDLSKIAMEFRHKALYQKSNLVRMPSEQLRCMREKQLKSGKAVTPGTT